MPTENRSSNTEMVSVPRDIIKFAVGFKTHGYKNLTEQHTDQRHAQDKLRAILAQPTQQHQGEPAVSIPDGYCLMPRRLTAENGAKALLLGEFKLEVTRECPECLELDEPADGCEICDGQGEYAQRHTIPWDQIKFIYSEAVKGLALKS
ncbi:hypothetical protein HU751_022800 [Pseudomonas sp. BW13M1]|uniref:Molecular chaperone DnaJ n=1 Tax=Pseudomonas peradeniyensis TaxID=2745488 RepID=A0A923K0J5_9PSED|nr:hypothetical protein [Pseudomonas peradeniyensis]MBV4507664.1 hypothetical protein [Pseudomonas peradeniyensis]